MKVGRDVAKPHRAQLLDRRNTSGLASSAPARLVGWAQAEAAGTDEMDCFSSGYGPW